ncbi:hypothetical protein G6F60_015565 [Rhizopus arrhizus]|nr:hypothetical protein G6F60_015565 [Rhizopus arrhizus]
MVNQAEPLLTAAVGGLGLILQPYEMLSAALARGDLVEVLPMFEPVSTWIHLLYPRDRQLTPKLRSFVDFCVARFSEQSMARR